MGINCYGIVVLENTGHSLKTMLLWGLRDDVICRNGVNLGWTDTFFSFVILVLVLKSKI